MPHSSEMCSVLVSLAFQSAAKGASSPRIETRQNNHSLAPGFSLCDGENVRSEPLSRHPPATHPGG